MQFRDTISETVGLGFVRARSFRQRPKLRWIEHLPSNSKTIFALKWTDEESRGPTDSFSTFRISNFRLIGTQMDPKIGM
jgi:hypothetical protein